MMLTMERPKQSVVKINKTFNALYQVKSRYMVIYGGRRSSKSFSVSQLLVRKACEFGDRSVARRAHFPRNHAPAGVRAALVRSRTGNRTRAQPLGAQGLYGDGR